MCRQDGRAAMTVSAPCQCPVPAILFRSCSRQFFLTVFIPFLDLENEDCLVFL